MSYKLQSANINDVFGDGIAILSNNGRLKDVTGTFVPVYPEDAIKLNFENGLKFNGILVENGVEHQLEFPIVIVRSDSSGITFKATGNPFQS